MADIITLSMKKRKDILEMLKSELWEVQHKKVSLQNKLENKAPAEILSESSIKEEISRLAILEDDLEWIIRKNNTI